jgi:hypothetical protein
MLWIVENANLLEKKSVVAISRPNTRSQKKSYCSPDNKSAHAPGRVVRNRAKPSRYK